MCINPKGVHQVNQIHRCDAKVDNSISTEPTSSRDSIVSIILTEIVGCCEICSQAYLQSVF